MHPLGELRDRVGGLVEGQAYVAVAARPLDAQGESVPVDGERLDAHRAVQAVRFDESGQPLDGVRVGVGEVGEQRGLGRGEGSGSASASSSRSTTTVPDGWRSTARVGWKAR